MNLRAQLLLPLILLTTATLHANNATFLLANELLSEGSHDLAAIEFRRFSTETTNPTEQAAAYLYASYAYLLDDNQLAERMLDRAESADASETYRLEHTLLSAETARKLKNPEEALYFYDLLASDITIPDYQQYARRRAASLHLSRGNINEARQELLNSPQVETIAIAALDEYAKGKDKRPLIGGLCGLIPGAGYWYSGEIGNGFRSLILNSLFIYGMVETAQDEEWGAFGIITFFEVTWYSGSIYGGVDAAERHNQNRLNAACDKMEQRAHFSPREVVIPVFKLNISF